MDCQQDMVPELTAVVFSYNRVDVIETTLRSVRFADRVMVVDKGSTDGSVEIGRRYADDFYSVPWSPTVESTKAEFIPTINSKWLLVLDDDECLNSPAIKYVKQAVLESAADVHYLPFRHYIVGRHEERAYYWPEYRPALFRCGTVQFTETVHGGTQRLAESHVYVDAGSGVSILHLSHPSSRNWIEKTNRYTDELNRASSISMADLTADGVIRLMEAWLNKIPPGDDPYLTAVAALRGIYDVVDVIKLWEQQQLESGSAATARLCEELNRDYDAIRIPKSSRP